MMPIATVSREPRRIEAYNGADLAGTQPCDQAVEAGACYRSACRAAEIIIDDFNIDESSLASDIDQIILAPFAIGHNLGLRRLAHIHDSLPLEDDRRNHLSAGHLQAPRSAGRPPALGFELAPR